jgi:hypothetical protein
MNNRYFRQNLKKNEHHRSKLQSIMMRRLFIYCLQRLHKHPGGPAAGGY